jgi:hypothetical protein
MAAAKRDSALWDRHDSRLEARETHFSYSGSVLSASMTPASGCEGESARAVSRATFKFQRTHSSECVGGHN